MRQQLKALWQDTRGATAVEYGLLLGAIAVVVAAAATSLGASTNNTFNTIRNEMS